MKTKNDKRVKNNGDNDIEKSRRPFNKKKYREQKYSLKYKVKQYEDRRNNAIKRSFFKSKKNDKESTSSNSNQDTVKSCSNSKQVYSLNDQWKFKAEQKLKEKEEKIKAMKEREEAIKRYQKKRIETNKKMTRKNKWGQPALHTRMEVLHERLMDKIKKKEL